MDLKGPGETSGPFLVLAFNPTLTLHDVSHRSTLPLEARHTQNAQGSESLTTPDRPLEHRTQASELRLNTPLENHG